MKYLVTKNVVKEQFLANEEVAEEQCAAMRGVVSFERVKGHEEAIEEIVQDTTY